MIRQVFAFCLTVGLMLAAAYFGGVAASASSGFMFDRNDVAVVISSMVFSLAGGLVSKRYGFVVAVTLVYLSVFALAIHMVGAASGESLLYLLGVNSPRILLTIASSMLGAFIGVRFARRRHEG